MARPIDPNSERSIAARLTVQMKRIITRKMVQCWQSKGYDLEDPVKLARQLRNQERMPAMPAPVVEPESKGDIPVEFAAKREVDLMFHIINVVTENFVGLTAEEMRKSLYVGMLLSYEDFYGGVLGDRVDVERRIREHAAASVNPT